MVTADTDDGEDIEIAVTASPPGETFASDGTMEVYVGVLDTAESTAQPIEDTAVTIEIQNPSGETVATFDETTDENGAADVALELEDHTDGSYTVSITHDETGETEAVELAVGPSLELTTFAGTATHVGQEETIALISRNGEEPAEDVEIDVDILDENGDVVSSESTVTDADGIAEVTFTPSEPGLYVIQPRSEDTVKTFSPRTTIEVEELTVETEPWSVDPVTQGQTASYYGRLTSIDGPEGDTDLEITFVPEEEDEVDPVTVETTTDEHGFFAVDYEVPEDATAFNVDIETDSGNAVAAGDPGSIFFDSEGEPFRSHSSDIDVNPAPTDDDGDATFVGLSVSIDDRFSGYAPGETVSGVVTARENGDPIENQAVELLFSYDSSFRGVHGAPVLSQTVETDANGEFETSVEIPDNAPDGADFTVTAEMEYQDEQYQADTWTQIQELDMQYNLEPGSFSVEVTDRQTGDAVAGVPVFFDEQFQQHRFGSYATGMLETDETGEASTTFTLPEPEHRGFVARTNMVDRYVTASQSWSQDYDYPGELQLEQDTVGPGEELDLSFEADAAASGIVFGALSHPAMPIAEPINTQDGGTLTVPENAVDGTSLTLTLWAADSDGQLYESQARVHVQEPGAVADFDVETDTPQRGEEVAFDASGSHADADIVSYEWDFGDGETIETSESTVEHTYEDAGDYQVELTITDAEGNTDSTTRTVTVEDEEFSEEDGPGFGVPAALLAILATTLFRHRRTV